MRILIVTAYFPPLNEIACLRPYSWAKYWSQKGHDVTVLTLERKGADLSINLPILPAVTIHAIPYPNWLNSLRDRGKGHMAPSCQESNPSIKSRLENSLVQLRKTTGIFSSNRFPDFTEFWVRPGIDKAMVMENFDCVISTQGPYTAHRIGYALKTQGKTKMWIADYRDLWVDNHISTGLFPFTAYEKFLERKLLAQADHITVVSQDAQDKMQARYGRKATILPNGFDPEDLLRLPEENYFSKKTINIVYTGTLYTGKQNPEPLFQALALLRKQHRLPKELQVHFAGGNLAHLKEKIAQYQLENTVHLLGKVPRNTALQLQRDADVLLFLEWNDPLAKGITSGKIFEYVYSKTPIMAIGKAKENSAQKILQSTQSGTYLGEDIQSIASYLIQITNQPLEKLSTAALPKEFTREYLANQVLQLMA